jgi:hypothetical protein
LRVEGQSHKHNYSVGRRNISLCKRRWGGYLNGGALGGEVKSGHMLSGKCPIYLDQFARSARGCDKLTQPIGPCQPYLYLVHCLKSLLIKLTQPIGPCQPYLYLVHRLKSLLMQRIATLSLRTPIYSINTDKYWSVWIASPKPPKPRIRVVGSHQTMRGFLALHWDQSPWLPDHTRCPSCDYFQRWPSCILGLPNQRRGCEGSVFGGVQTWSTPRHVQHADPCCPQGWRIHLLNGEQP